MKSPARWNRKTQIGVAIVVAAFLVFALSILMQWRSEEEFFVSNILFFSLFNLNVIALLVLVVLVVRNVIKLMFERRKGILGAKLRSRLMGSFVLIALIPMGLSFLVASGLINQAMEGWFSTQVDSIVTSSLTVARQYVNEAKVSVSAAAGRVAKELQRKVLEDGAGARGIEQQLEELRHLNELFSIKLLSGDGRILAESSHATAGVDAFAEPDLDSQAVRQARGGKEVLLIEERGAGQFIRVYSPLGTRVLVSSYRMDPEMVHAQGVVSDANGEYQELRRFKDPLRTNFFLILALFNLLTLFGAVWIAFFVSKQITGPIQKLAEGTRSVAKGDYDFALDPARDDEIGYLVASFNQMLTDLKGSRHEAERRGLLIQAILANLAVGVIALDTEKRVTAVNSAAGTLLEIGARGEAASGLLLSELLTSEHYAQVGPVLESLSAPGEEGRKNGSTEVEFRLRTGGRELLVLCTGGRISGSEGNALGYVLLFDDVTEISRSQHLAAWRDVARRIAHEIKNPLTPLQLSAQRLEKLLESAPQSSAVSESTRSIVEHVEIIKRLANEFSEYGRMPTAQFVATELAALLGHTINSLKADHPNVQFSYTIEGKIPEMLIDPEQIRGVFINIFTNAISAISSQERGGVGGMINTVIRFDRSRDRATIEIADNGPGIPAEDKNRIFEPYFTTKKGGTGLGLAIVSSVISDHQGEVRIFDNKPHGVRFVLILPQYPQVTTTRKLSVAGAAPSGNTSA